MLSCADVARADAKLGDFGLARLIVEGERRKKEVLDGQQAAPVAARCGQAACPGRAAPDRANVHLPAHTRA